MTWLPGCGSLQDWIWPFAMAVSGSAMPSVVIAACCPTLPTGRTVARDPRIAPMARLTARTAVMDSACSAYYHSIVTTTSGLEAAMIMLTWRCSAMMRS